MPIIKLKTAIYLLSFSVILLAAPSFAANQPEKSPLLFGYEEIDQPDLNYLPQWLNVLAKHPKEDLDRSNGNINKWFFYLDSLRDTTKKEQISKVNDYINQYKYVIDPSNYGVEDYWAVVREFFNNFGDCEDYAISKYFSLRFLHFPADSLRIIIVQDTNLEVAHAILAVLFEGEVLILDNQSDEVMPQEDIVHYVPLYSVNEQQWWLHLPKQMNHQ